MTRAAVYDLEQGVQQQVATYINLLRRYDTDRDVTDLADFLNSSPFGE